MNTKYLYTKSGFVLPEFKNQAEFDCEYPHGSHANYLSSLPAIPVQGTHGFEVGKWYTENVDFKLELRYVEPPPEIHCNRGGDRVVAIPLPPQATQDKPEQDFETMKFPGPKNSLLDKEDGDHDLKELLRKAEDTGEVPASTMLAFGNWAKRHGLKLAPDEHNAGAVIFLAGQASATKDKAGIETGEQLYRLVPISVKPAKDGEYPVKFFGLPSYEIKEYKESEGGWLTRFPKSMQSYLEPIPTPAERTFTLDEMQGLADELENPYDKESENEHEEYRYYGFGMAIKTLRSLIENKKG